MSTFNDYDNQTEEMLTDSLSSVGDEIQDYITDEDEISDPVEKNNQSVNQVLHSIEEQAEEDDDQQEIRDEIKYTMTNILDMVDMLYQQSLCQTCQSSLSCSCCSKKQHTQLIPTANLISHKPERSYELLESPVDVIFDHFTNQLVMSSQSKSVIIRPEDIPVKRYNKIYRADNDYFPIIKSVGHVVTDLKSQLMDNETARLTYGTASGKQNLNKIIHDNSVKFSKLTDYTICYMDFETYCQKTWSNIPYESDSSAQIGIACLHLAKYQDGILVDQVDKHGKKVKYLKLAFINNCRQYDMSQIGDDIELILAPTESDLCIGILDYLYKLQQQVFICTFAGSVNQYSHSKTEFGYDNTWLIRRSRLNIHPITKTLKVEETQVDGNIVMKYSGQSLTHIQELPMLQFVDMQYLLWRTSGQDVRNAMSDQSLETWSQYYGLGGKLDHDYYDLQKRLATDRSAISDLILYCDRDVALLPLLEDKRGIISGIIALQHILRCPISHAIHHTLVSNMSLKLQQLFIDQGYLVTYFANPTVQDVKIKGAFTSTVAEPGKIYKNLIAPDFKSLYVNVIIANNICLTTLGQQGRVIDITDDETRQSDNVTFGNETSGILSGYIKQISDMRNEYNDLVKSDPTNKAKWNALQLQLKIMGNATFGYCCYQQSLLYCLPIAQAITAGARMATKYAIDIAQNDFKCEFLAADTDSLFIIPPNTYHFYKQQLALVDELNVKIADRFQTDRLVLVIEETIPVCSFIEGKKSYLSILVKTSDALVIGYNLDTKLEDCEWELKTRGISWAGLSQRLRDQLATDIQTFLKSTGITARQFYDQVRDRESKKISDIIKSYNMNLLGDYAQKVKLSSNKSDLVKRLLDLPVDYGNQTHASVILMSGVGNKTDRKLPLQLISPAMINRVDSNELLDHVMGTYKKFFLTKDEKKSTGKSQFKCDMDIVYDNLDSDSVMVRREKVNRSGFVHRQVMAIPKSELVSIIKRDSECSYHEIISSADRIRCVFDCDGDVYSDDIKKITDIVNRFTGRSLIPHVLESSHGKSSMHIYFDVVLEMSFMRLIANEISKEVSSIDAMIYRHNGSLRLPMTGKVVGNQLQSRHFICPMSDISKYLVSDIHSYEFISTPIHRMDKLFLDSYYQVQSVVVSDSDIGLVKQFCKTNKIDAELSQTGNRVDIRSKQRYSCPVHIGKIHEHDNMFAIIQECKIHVYCYRSSPAERKDQFVVITKKTIADLVVTDRYQANLDRVDRLIGQCNNSFNQLKHAIIQDNKYFQCDIARELDHCDILVCKSQMGSGKTVAIEQFLKQSCDKVVITSNRLSYTQDISARYGIASYNNISNSIDLDHEKRVIIQIESLKRLYGSDNSIVILDECESMITQLASSVSLTNEAGKHFIRLLQSAKKIIILDAILQQSTVDLIMHLSGKKSIKVLQNLHKPKTDYTMDVKLYQKINSDNDLIIHELSNKLANGMNISCCITSNKLAQAVFNHFKDQYDCKIYHGKDTQIDDNGLSHYKNKHNELSNVSENWRTRLLITTSTCSAGINFPDIWFTEAYHVYHKMTCLPMDLIQSCHRIRHLSNRHVTLWLQLDQSVVARRCNEYLIADHQLLADKNLNLQLQIAVNLRKEAMQQYRDPIIFKSLAELGYQLNHVTTRQSVNHVTLSSGCDSKYLAFTKVITDQDLQLVDKIKINKNILLDIDLDKDFGLKYSKIVQCQMAKIDPVTHTLSMIGDEIIIEDWAKEIVDNMADLLTYQSSRQLLVHNTEMIDAIVKNDVIRQTLSGISDKRVNPLKHKEIIQSQVDYCMLRQHVNESGILVTSNLPLEFTCQRNCKRNITKAFASNRLIADEISKKTIQGKCIYTYQIKEMITQQ